MIIEDINEQGPKRISLWVTRLTPAYGNNVQAVFKMGKVLRDAREELKPLRHWTKFLKDDALPFGARKAQNLIRIYANLGALPAQTIARLPVGWAILYVLTVLNPDEITSLIEQGEIHPRLTLAEARLLTGKTVPKEPRLLGALEWALKVEDQAAEHLSEWEELQKGQAAEKLLQVVKRLQSAWKTSKPPQEQERST
jgi:hypothetical protein